MPYLGNTAGNRFVASKAATQFSGDGSTTAFTLDHAVGSDEDILVSVDGVIQEPSVAYAVSNGTTLTFTAAPSNNSGNNIFVYYLFRTVGTVDHPSTSALQATSGTFTGNIVIPDAGNIGSASDTDAMAISSGGVVTFSQKPVFSSGGGGKILKFQKVTFTAEFQTQNDSFTDITNATLSFTPTASDSTLRITSMLHIYLGQGSSTTVGGAFQIVHDGTALEAPANQQYYKSAGSGTQIFQLPHYFTNYVSAGSTSARTIKAQGRCYAGSNAAEFLVNKGGAYTSHIEVLEIGA